MVGSKALITDSFSNNSERDGGALWLLVQASGSQALRAQTIQCIAGGERTEIGSCIMTSGESGGLGVQ